MTTKVVPGMLVATPDAATHAKEAGARLAKALREAIAKRGHASLALSGGGTPLPAYTAMALDTRIDWTKVHVFWIDERAVPPDHARSNYAAAKLALLDPAGVPAANVHRMPGEAADLDAAALAYEALVRELVQPGFEEAPSFDVAVMGIGDDGHTASLFPGDPAVHIRDRLAIAVAAADGRDARLTVTAPMIENARALFILAMGKAKAQPLEAVWMIEGDVETTPARILRGGRGSITWIIDRAAGGLGPS